MTMESLLKFRTTFLRAIAEAWVDESFRRDLTRLQPGSAIKALKTRLDYSWPWLHVCDLEVADAGDKFQWIHNEWIWSSDLTESLTMYLPLDPVALDIPPKYHATALADYYRQHSSLFSDDWGAPFATGSTGSSSRPPSEVRGVAAGTNSGQQARATSTSGTALSGAVSRPPSSAHGVATRYAAPAGGFMPSDTDFTAFSVALIAAMAQAWHDKEFRAVLLLDAAKALHTIRGYILPWNFAVVVKDAPRSRWQPRTEHEGPSHWVFEERQVLQLNLPSKPSDLYSEPVALAAYNATGAEYPFSCCT